MTGFSPTYLRTLAFMLAAGFMWMILSAAPALAQSNVNCTEPGVTCSVMPQNQCPETQYNDQYCYDTDTGECLYSKNGVWRDSDPDQNRTRYNMCETFTFEQRSLCGRTRDIEGELEQEWYPDTDNYCTGETFEQNDNCYNMHTRTASGTMAPIWSPEPSEICNSVGFTQETQNCVGSDEVPLTRAATGTKTESSSYSPPPSQYCQGTSFTQLGECGDSRLATGTSTDTQWLPDPASYCTGKEVSQTRGCLIQNADGTNQPSTREVSGTKTGPECCEDTTWNPPRENVCIGKTVEQTSNCGRKQTVGGTKSDGACCTDTVWKPDPASVCEDEPEFYQYSNCGKQSANMVKGTKKGGKCAVGEGDCLPGLPCVKPMSVPQTPFDGKIETLENDKAFMSDSGACDADFMNQIYAKAYLEAERENILLQSAVRKPDSVLEYSCFKNFVNAAAFWSPRTFSETKKWSKTACQDDEMSATNPVKCDALPPKLYEVEIDGRIDNTDQPPTELEVYMAQGLAEDETRLGNNLERLVMQSLNAYLNDSGTFSHSYLGGSADPINTGLLNNHVDGNVIPNFLLYDPTDPLDTDCIAMNTVWHLAKCSNYGEITDPVSDFAALYALDPRLFPQRCEVDGDKILKKTQMIGVASNRLDPTNSAGGTRVFPYSMTDSPQYVSTPLPGNAPNPEGVEYFDLLGAENCAAPVPTGLMVKTYEYETDIGGNLNTVIEEHAEYVCVNPGCYYDKKSETCKKTPD